MKGYQVIIQMGISASILSSMNF